MKKFIRIAAGIFLLLIALLSLMRIYWKDYLPDLRSYLPSSITQRLEEARIHRVMAEKEARIHRIIPENDSLINDLFVISQRSRTEPESHRGYCISAWMDYQEWFKKNKTFIAEIPELKEHVIKNLKEVVALFAEYSKQDKDYFFSNLIGLIKSCLDELKVG